MPVCPKCKAGNPEGSRFCGQCREQLSGDPGTWGLGPHDFARVYEVADVPGWITRPLTITPNQKALVFVQGQFEGVVPGGVVDMGGLIRRITSLGRAQSMQAVVIHEAPVTLTFRIEGLKTADALTVTAVYSVGVQVSNEMLFFRSALGNARVYDLLMLRRLVYASLRQAAARAMSRVTADDVRADSDRLVPVEQEVGRRVRDVLSQVGLQVTGIAIANIQHDGLDLLDKQREQRMVETLLGDEEIAAEEAAFARDRQREAQTIRREQAEKVDDETRRLDIREQVRRLLLKERMAEVRLTEDEAELLAKVTREQLLRADEIEAVRRSLDEKNADHELDRQHALDLLTLRQAQELLEARSGLDVAEIEAEIRRLQTDLERQGVLQSGQQELELRDLNHSILSRMRAVEASIDEDRKRYEAELARRRAVVDQEFQERLAEAKTEAEIRQIEFEQDRIETEWGVDLQHRRKLDQLIRLERQQALRDAAADRELDRRIRLLDAEHANKLALIGRMASLSTEQLMAVVDNAERAAILADVRKMEITAGMTEEQILAVSAKDAPHVADAIRARWEALAETKSAHDLAAMAERLVEAEREHTRQVQEVYERSADRAADQATKSLEAMRDVATAAATGNAGGTTVVMPSGQVIGTGRGGAVTSGAMVLCSHCRSEVPAGEKHCSNCGEKV